MTGEELTEALAWRRASAAARAWAAFKQSHELAAEIRWDPGMLMNEVFLAYLEGDATGEDTVERLEAAIHHADRLELHESRLLARWLLGRVLWGQGQDGQAREIWNAGVQLAERLDAIQLGRDLRSSLASLD